MNSNNNNNNNRLCRNGQTDDLNACRGQVADGNEYGLCHACELKRRQDALDEIFARHNMSASASTDDVIDHCEKCHRDIHVGERTYIQRTHSIREEDGEDMVEDMLVCSDCDRGDAVAGRQVGRVIRRTAGGRVRTMPAHRGVDCTVCGRTIYDGTGTVCSGCVGEGFTAPITATVVQPTVEAVAVQAVTLTAPPQHDDCCCCLGNEATNWTKMACGHEVCSDCHTSLRNSDVTSVTSRDALILGMAGVCQRDVICPLCRAQNQSNDPVELHQRLARYRQKVTDMTESNRRSCDEIRRMARVECDATRRASDAEIKRLRDIADGNKRDFNASMQVIEDLKRQLAEAKGRPAKTCDGCSKPQEDDRVPYCNGCMSALYGENWAEDNGLVPPAQKVGGGGARADERVVVRQMYKPDTSVTRAEAMAIERQAGMGGARAVLVGGGGGGDAPTPRRPCRTPNCETAKPTQRRCPGNGCLRNHRDTPCCKRCDTCPQCKV